MLNPSKLLAAAAVALTLATAVPAMAETGSRDPATEEANRQMVIDFYNRVFNEHDLEGAVGMVADDYIQHNPNVPTGKAPFVEFFTRLFAKNPNASARIVRSSAQGDLVWLHVHAGGNKDGTGGLAIMDIYRVKDGKIVEHWDVVQPVPAKAANENTMF